jgi:hypothetical protein
LRRIAAATTVVHFAFFVERLKTVVSFGGHLLCRQQRLVEVVGRVGSEHDSS